MTDDAVQMRAPDASTTPPARAARSPATPPPSGGQLLVSTAMIPPPETEPPSPPPPAGGGEPRYTLEEARELLDAESCTRDGHDLRQVRWGAGPVVRVGCRRCPVMFVPPELPDLPPDTELREDVFRSGREPGSVRVTHIPTGTVAVGYDGETEMENQIRARKMLRAALYIASLGGKAGSSTRPAPPDPDWLNPTPGGR